MFIFRSAYIVLLKISKFLFTTIAFAHITVVADALQKNSGKELTVSNAQHNYAVFLQQAVQHIPNTYHEYVIRSLAVKLGQSLGNRAISHMPSIDVIRAIQRICWVSAIGRINLLQGDVMEIHKQYESVCP